MTFPKHVRRKTSKGHEYFYFATGAILDITTILSREQTHIESFPDELGVKIEIAADKRRKAIESTRSKGAVEGVGA